MIEIDDWMSWEKRGQVCRHPDGTHTRSTAAMRDAESLVKVEVADVGTNISGPAESYLRVHVRPIHVYLPAVLVDDTADLPDGALEDTVGRWVRDHQRRGRVRMRLRFPSKVLDIDVPSRVALDGDDLHAGHHGAGRVGSVR